MNFGLVIRARFVQSPRARKRRITPFPPPPQYTLQTSKNYLLMILILRAYLLLRKLLSAMFVFND